MTSQSSHCWYHFSLISINCFLPFCVYFCNKILKYFFQMLRFSSQSSWNHSEKNIYSHAATWSISEKLNIFFAWKVVKNSNKSFWTVANKKLLKILQLECTRLLLRVSNSCTSIHVYIFSIHAGTCVREFFV